jgi:AraC-like DNA-binding protein
MLYLFGILLAFFLALVLFTKSGKSGADIILACWLSLIGIHLSLFYASGIAHPYYSILGFPLPLIHGPFLYFYTAFLTHQHALLKKHWFWHFIPVAIGYILLIPFILLPHAGKIEVFENSGKGYEIQSLIINALIDLSGIFYFSLSLFVLRKHAKFIQNRFSDIEKINLNWLRYLIYGIGLIWIAVLFRNDIIIYSLVSLFIIFLGYFGIKQVGIFTQNTPVPLGEFTGIIEENIGSGLKPKVIEATAHKPFHLDLHRNLLQLMEKEKPFLNPELAIAELAALLETHPNTLSQVINSLEAKTFYDYINEKRIEEFKRIALLPESQKFTMITLAYDCGFNSKTAFYRNFKKSTGQSPTEYLTQLHIALK